MAILQTCCFFNSVRKGSYASAIYTLIYFLINCIAISIFLYDERKYLLGEVEKPQKISFLKNSPTTVIFNMLLLMCAAFGVVGSILLIIGLKKDQREFLLPWILVMIAQIFVETIYIAYLTIFEELRFELLNSIIFTMDFFIVCLNMYCLICVVSQYQELKAGRGRKELLICANKPQYVPPTQTHFDNGHNTKSKKIYTPSIINGHTNCTVIPEESFVNGNSNVRKSPFQRRKHTILLKKQVKFTDDLKCCSDVITTILPDANPCNGNGRMFIIDTLPEFSEYSENVLTWQEQQNKQKSDQQDI